MEPQHMNLRSPMHNPNAREGKIKFITTDSPQGTAVIVPTISMINRKGHKAGPRLIL